MSEVPLQDAFTIEVVPTTPSVSTAERCYLETNMTTLQNAHRLDPKV